MFPTRLIILLFTMGAGAVPYPTLSSVHLTTHHSGLTILMCVVNDIHQGEMELAWISSGTRGTRPATYSLFQSVDGIQSAMSLISVASSEWTSYTCFVSHRVSDRLTHRHYAGLPKETEMYDLEKFDDEETPEMCSDHHSSFLEGNMSFVYPIIY
ncbi:hypothetical protein IRJ41_002701 [Triplophysa rosa]|uniref:Ig-like domain-containing protein n=1 Tax=Triplophysa rosa TaxID=992332 RepID=A0A9W8CAM1_TRIRA|nr:hypothetical protein IRJ41_002701 [Triplophysa rosa]